MADKPQAKYWERPGTVIKCGWVVRIHAVDPGPHGDKVPPWGPCYRAHRTEEVIYVSRN